MPARPWLLLCLAFALAAVVAATSATAAPINRTTSLISTPTGVPDPNSADVDFRAASKDGSRVFLETDQRLALDDTDGGLTDVYERTGGVTTLLSTPTGIGDPQTGGVFFDGASDDGTHVFLETTQKMTSDDNDTSRTDIYERFGGATTLVSGPTGVADTDQSVANFEGNTPDGSHVFFDSADNLSSDDTDTSTFDLWEHSAGITRLVSQPTGTPETGTGGSNFCGASEDGSQVFFTSSQKMTADDGDGTFADVYERAGGTTTLVSVPTGVADPANGNADCNAVSAEGNRVIFDTPQQLTSDDGDGSQGDIYERSAGITTLVSGATSIADPGSSGVDFEAASKDASRLFFTTDQKLSGNDGDSDRGDIYEHSAGATTLASGPTGVAAPDSDSPSLQGISDDGSHVFFETTERLSAADNDSDLLDAYEHSGGATRLVSESTGVSDPDDDDADFGGWSADGSRVFFSTGQKMTVGDGDSETDVYERAGGVTTFVSRETGTPETNTDGAVFEGVSADGLRVFFRSNAKMTGDDGDSGLRDVYMAADTSAPQTTITSGPGAATTDHTPTFGFSSNEAGASFRCKVDSGAFAPCSSPQTLALADGSHTFQVRATDNASNFDGSPASSTFTVFTPAGGGGGGTGGPTDAQIKAALAGDLKAAAKVIKKARGRKLRKRKKAKVKGVDCLRAGTVRITGKAKRQTILSGRRRCGKAGKGTLTLKVTKKGRKALKRKLKITLSGSFTDRSGHKTSAKSRKVTVKRR
jgi:hypothetical protein